MGQGCQGVLRQKAPKWPCSYVRQPPLPCESRVPLRGGACLCLYVRPSDRDTPARVGTPAVPLLGHQETKEVAWRLTPSCSGATPLSAGVFPPVGVCFRFSVSLGQKQEPLPGVAHEVVGRRPFPPRGQPRGGWRVRLSGGPARRARAKPERAWGLRCFMASSLSFSRVSYWESDSGCCLLVAGLGHQWGMFGYQDTRGILSLSCFIRKSLYGRKERGSDLPVPPPGPRGPCASPLPVPSLPEATERFPVAGGYFLLATSRASQNGALRLPCCVPWFPPCSLIAPW